MLRTTSTAAAVCLLSLGGSAYGRAREAGGVVSQGRVLRVCADPDNLPYSNRQGQGFENRIATVIARGLGATVAYTWWPEQRGFLRHTLSAGRCDAVIGITAGADRVLTTEPYYCSSYMFVERRARRQGIRSFDDPRLRNLKIGVPVIGQDYNSLPPAVALARRGLVQHVVGYTLFASDATDGPWAKLIDAVARGDVDVAIAWGPPAGYYRRRARVSLDLVPVSESPDAGVPFTYAIAVGVRRDDVALRGEVQRVLTERHTAIQRILRAYGVPLVHNARAQCG